MDYVHHESITKANFCDTCCHQYSDICGTCESLEGVPVKYRKKTNADRIRNMTDEELAKTISGDAIYPWCTEGPCYESCTDCVLAWLKQEVE